MRVMDAIPSLLPDTFRVVSANLQHGRGANLQPNAWTYLLNELHADLVCAQESRRPAEYGLHPSLLQLFVSAKDRDWGSAVLATRGELAPIEFQSLSGSVVTGFLRTQIGGVNREVDVYSIHIGGKGEREYLKNTTSALERTTRGTRHRIVAGDFNVTVARRRPEEHLSNSDGELRLLAMIEEEFGLVNAWASCNPTKPLAQTLRWSGNPKAPHHCDGIFVDRSLLPYVVAAEVHESATWRRMTDHNPVVVDFAR
jgi:endonuclease/exonuclease/phosphatase family metal-dependent hydrolase